MLVLTLAGCVPAPQIDVKASCDKWAAGLDSAHTETLAQEFVDGDTATVIKKRIKTWQSMVDLAKKLGPQVHNSDALVEGYYAKFADAGERAISAANSAVGGATDAVQVTEEARKKFLDAFYSIAQSCFGEALFSEDG